MSRAFLPTPPQKYEVPWADQFSREIEFQLGQLNAAVLELQSSIDDLTTLIEDLTDAPHFLPDTAPPAAGNTTSRILISNVSGFGIYWGTGAPTVSAAQGSLYLRRDGTTTNNRMYVNTNGSTTWTAVTTAA